jgi:hypothetical protein
MIEDPTVLVLGAGASMPYGFPSGRELFVIINKALAIQSTSPVTLWGRLKDLGIEQEKIPAFRSALIFADPPSVDAFLEHREEFLEVGKLSIALSLIPFENERRLFNMDRDEDMPNSWYRYLMDKLEAINCTDFKRNRLSIITFNYDRSLEHYLFTTLKNRYGITDQECSDAISAIPFIHVHGSLGSLPWQGGLFSRPFKKTGDLHEIRMASRQIIIMSEKAEDAEVFRRAYELMNEASKIYFLGFGYHQTNLRRLGMAKLIKKGNIYGTSLGLGTAEWRSISDTWRIAFKGDKIDILGLFRNYYPL